MNETVWMTQEQVHGILVCMGAEFSLIKYDYMGLTRTVWVENDDFEVEDNT